MNRRPNATSKARQRKKTKKPAKQKQNKKNKKERREIMLTFSESRDQQWLAGKLSVGA
jgi:hypothetical protein